MPYTMTAREFFEGHLSQGLKHAPALTEVGGTVLFEISGPNGGTWTVDLSRGVVSQNATPDCIVRAADRDFMALLEGRMSVSDGVITERLQVSGEAQRLSRLFEALKTLRPTDSGPQLF